MDTREKYVAVLEDLLAERTMFGERWVPYYDAKIKALRAAIEDKFACASCGGTGGYDATRDCEVYDDWRECLACGGTGEEQ